MLTENEIYDLAEIGFEPVTQWILNGDRIKLMSLEWVESSGWIYCFVIQGRVKYIGITIRVLRSRMDNYRDLANDRVRALIRKSLESGDVVEVYGLRRPDVSQLVLEEEERHFISKLDPDWNIRR